MINLIRNELLKIFRRPGTFVMLGLVAVFIIASGAVLKYYENDNADAPSEAEWKAELAETNSFYKEEIEQYSMNKTYTDNLERNVALNEYRIENNISPYEDYSMWSFVNDSAIFIDFVGMFLIIVAAGIVASEFGWGTIKLLLIRPLSRTKILTSKYITVLLFGAIMLALLYVLSIVVGGLLFGSASSVTPHLVYMSGKVYELPMGLHLLIYYGLNSISMLMLATMAFMISAAFRNNSLAIGISLFLLLMGGNLTQLIALKFDWAKYILFANTNLMQYIDGTPVVEGMTLPFSIVVLIVYFVIFQFIAFYIFKKRDVSA